MENIFQTNLEELLRIIISAFIIYVLIVVYIRILGKRSTSELNNFDWIVTVSVGSIAASTLILKDVSVTEGGIAILFLFLLQYLVTKIMFQSETVREVVKSTPQLLLFKGEFIDENMKEERVLEPEVYAAIRQAGYKSVEQIYAIVLETNSKISVIADDDSDDIGFSLSDVQGLPKGLKDDLKDKGKAE